MRRGKQELQVRNRRRRPASRSRLLTVLVGLIVLTAAPLYGGAVSLRPAAVLATPAAPAAPLGSLTTFPTTPSGVTGPAFPPAAAESASLVAAATPEATPAPTGVSALFALTTTTCAGLARQSPIEMAQLARAAGFPDGQVAVAVAIALAESSGHPAATNHNTNGSFDFGLWQINTVRRPRPADHRGLVRSSRQRSNGPHRLDACGVAPWTPWLADNSGAYLTHLAAANQAAQALGAPTAPEPSTTPTQAPHEYRTGTIRQPHPDGNTHPVRQPHPQPDPDSYREPSAHDQDAGHVSPRQPGRDTGGHRDVATGSVRAGCRGPRQSVTHRVRSRTLGACVSSTWAFAPETLVHYLQAWDLQRALQTRSRTARRHHPAARAPAGLHRRPPDRTPRAAPRRHPRRRRRPRRQDHLARPRPARRLPDRPPARADRRRRRTCAASRTSSSTSAPSSASRPRGSRAAAGCGCRRRPRARPQDRRRSASGSPRGHHARLRAQLRLRPAPGPTASSRAASPTPSVTSLTPPRLGRDRVAVLRRAGSRLERRLAEAAGRRGACHRPITPRRRATRVTGRRTRWPPAAAASRSATPRCRSSASPSGSRPRAKMGPEYSRAPARW